MTKNVYLWHRFMQSNCLHRHAHKPVSECLATDTDIWHKKIDSHYLPYVHFRVYTQRSSNTLSHTPRKWQLVTDATRSDWTWQHFTCCFPVKGALPGAGGWGDHFATEGETEFPTSLGWHVTRPWQSNPDRIKRSAITQSWQAAASRQAKGDGQTPAKAPAWRRLEKRLEKGLGFFQIKKKRKKERWAKILHNTECIWRVAYYFVN